MKDEIIDPTIGMNFPIDHNPNDILFAKALKFWDSISEEQHMLDHETMMKNIEEQAREDSRRQPSLNSCNI